MSGPPFRLAAAFASVALGVSVSVFNMFDWAQYQYYFAKAGGSPSSILSFYAAEAISIFLLLLGLYLAYAYAMASSGSRSSLLSIIGSALSDRSLSRAAAASTLLYGAVYSLSSSILVFQPTVNFASAYGVTTPTSWSSVPCCGEAGTLPKLVLYLSPAHLAVQLVPLSLLLLFIVPPLVGLNLAIALFSVRRTVATVTGRWMVACGAAVGLFTACPTCAGFFLAESLGGVAATTLSVALAPYQSLFIAVSIPLLVAMPFFFAARVRRASPLAPVGPGPRAPLPAGNR